MRDMCAKFEMNTVQYMLQARRSEIPYIEKLTIKKLGRPVPDMKIVTMSVNKARALRRSFSVKYYEKYPWMCGCDVVKAMFCYPCLLFGGREENMWTGTGVTDLKHLCERANKHVTSPKHLKSELELVMLGGVNLRQQLRGDYTAKLTRRRETVDKNRFLLSKVIDCLKTCGAYDLAIGGRGSSPAFVSELVNATASLNGAISKHLEDATTAFEGTSLTVHEELLDTILEVYREVITEQIASASFLAVQVDEVRSSASSTAMTLLTFRYEMNGEFVERFWGFFDAEVDGLSNVILRELEKTNVVTRPEILVSQSYDGASAMSASSEDQHVHVKIRRVYRGANYVHSYVHDINELIRQSTSKCDKTVAKFFNRLETFYTFFSRSSKRAGALTAMVNASQRRAVLPCWDSSRNTVNTVFLYRDEIRQYLQQTIDTCGRNKHVALSLIDYLVDDDFTYWLTFFHKVIFHVNFLFDHFEKSPSNHFQAHLRRSITVFNLAISSLRKDDKEEKNVSDSETVLKQPQSKTRDEITNNVCDVIRTQIEERLRFTDHVVASQLLESDKFCAHSQLFPDKRLSVVIGAYPKLNRCKLHSELEVIYHRDELHSVECITALLQLFIANNLTSTFSETVKLVRILGTIPMPTTEKRRCFKTLKRAKTFFRNVESPRDARVSALGVLSIERRFLGELADLNTRVIDKFARGVNRRERFLYE